MGKKVACPLFLYYDMRIDKELEKLVNGQIDVPRDLRFGDFTTNVAMVGGGSDPHQAAEALVSSLRGKLETWIEKAEVVGPGFVNFFLNRTALWGVVDEILELGGDFGRSEMGEGRRLLLEFVSANPTGPLTIAHARQAAVGDSLARLLEFSGYKVTREYYLNDEGRQMNILGESVRARYLEKIGAPAVFPEEGYQGEYVKDIADEIFGKYGRGAESEPLEFFTEIGCADILDEIKQDLKDFGVSFDNWTSQRKLRCSGKIEEALAELRSKGYVFDSEGAVWFKSTAFGDDKDRVVIKSDGSWTYLLPDIAYHKDKFARGFEELLDIWGPDHHGYVPRVKAAVLALGFSLERLSVLIVQLATVFRKGKPVRMSTRRAEYVTLRETLDEVGRDAARFDLLMRTTQSHLDFDLDVAKSNSMENPVYYVQYAHARCASILKKAADSPTRRLADPPTRRPADPNLTQIARPLLRLLHQFPIAIEAAAKTREPHRLAAYLLELAGGFHNFYEHERVITEEEETTHLRLALIRAIKQVLATGLELLGASAPKEM